MKKCQIELTALIMTAFIYFLSLTMTKGQMKVKWNGNFREKIFENLGIAHEVVLFSGKLCKSLNISKANESSGESAIFNSANGTGLSFPLRCSQSENSVPFAHGNFRKFTPEFLVEW